MKVRTNNHRGEMRERIVKGPVRDPGKGSRSFRRRHLMKVIKATHRRLVMMRKDTRKPVLPRPTEKFRAQWALR